MTNLLASQQPAPIPVWPKWCEEGDHPYFAISNGPTVYKCIICHLYEENDRMEAALTALRDFMWSEGYADQAAVMRQADAALGMPTTKEFMQKVCSDAYEGTPGREKP